MKNIEAVSIWDNGTVQQATVLNAYANNVSLNNSATFTYSLYKENMNPTMLQQLAYGTLIMTGEAYEQWTVDSYAWDWVAGQLNLTITGDYIPPVPPDPTPEPTPEPEPEPIVEETTTTEEVTI